MLSLSEELRQARKELRTWAILHATEDDSDRGVWRALLVIGKAIAFVEQYEEDQAL